MMQKIALLIPLFTSSSALAGECKMTVTRVACPGHEETCYSKCAGKPSCDEVKKTGSAESCQREAVKNCHVFRPGETKSKKVSATFEGKPLEGGKNFCEPEKPEYQWNSCK